MKLRADPARVNGTKLRFFAYAAVTGVLVAAGISPPSCLVGQSQPGRWLATSCGTLIPSQKSALPTFNTRQVLLRLS